MTSQQSEGHTFNPYLLRGVVVNWMPQVWSVDMPYSGLQAGAVHAGAMIDWVDRYDLNWAVSITAERAPSGVGLPDASDSVRRMRKQSADQASDKKSPMRLQIFTYFIPTILLTMRYTSPSLVRAALIACCG